LPQPPTAGAELGDAALRGLLLLALFATYPLALFCPIRTGPALVFYFQLPAFFAAALAATVWLLATAGQRAAAPPAGGGLGLGQRRWAGAALAAFAAVVAWTALSAFANRTAELPAAVETLGLFALPLLAALHPRLFRERTLARLLAMLWLLHAGHALWQVAVGYDQTVGLAGNRNWQGTMTAALLPFVGLALWPERGWRASTSWRRTAWLLPVAAAAVAAIFLMVKAESRGAWLGLAAYGALAGFHKLGWKLRLPAAAAALGLAAVLWLAGRDYLAGAAAADIRPPLWRGTAAMVAAHPLGVGPANFRREYPLYKPLAHKARPVAAEVTEHSHNEPLRLAAELGVPVALLWLALLLPLALPAPAGGFNRAAHVAAFLAVAHAMFDKTLVQPPLCVAGLLLLGWLWRPWLAAARPSPPPLRSPQSRAWLNAAVLLLVVPAAGWGLWASTRLTLASWWLRQGRLLAYDRTRPEAEYAAFRRAAEWTPESVEAQTRAGLAALHGPRSPQRALPHLLRARDLEPYFAHVNGEIGNALGSLGRPAEAQPFFLVDVEQFPFSPLARRRLLFAALLNGDLATARAQAGHLAELDARFARIRNPELLRRLPAWDPGAVAPGPALALAAALEPLLAETLPDPLAARLAAAGQLPPGVAVGALTAADARRWRALAALRGLLPAAAGLASPEPVLAARVAAPAELKRLPAWLWLLAADFDVLVRRPETGGGEWLLARRGGEFWRIDPAAAAGEAGRVASWVPRAADAAGGGWACPVPVSALSQPLELLRHLRRTAAPPLATDLPAGLDAWPSLRLLAWRQELARRLALPPAQVPLAVEVADW
jgi:O-antigen ligase